MNNLKKKFFLSFIFLLLSCSFFNFNSNVNLIGYMDDIRTSSASDISLDESSLTIPYGTNLQEDRPYEFSGAFYDITNDTREWTTPALLETRFVLDPDVAQNDTITDMNNVERQSPDNSSISMTHGTQNANGTLDQLDGDYANFSSTPANPVEATNLTVNHGNLVSSGDLMEIDGDYMTFNSSGLGNYPATYTFLNDLVGSNPSGMSTYEFGSGYINVIGSQTNHSKVLEFNDNDASGGCSITITVSNLEHGSIEFWCYKIPTYGIYLQAQQTSTTAIYKQLTSTLLGVSAPLNQWNHIRFDFECGNGNYSGLSADTWKVYINDVESTPDPFSSGVDYFNKFIIFSSTANNQPTSFYVDAIGFDGIGYDYEIGDNLNQDPLELEVVSTINCDLLDNLVYSFSVNVSQQVEVSLYNFTIGDYQLIDDSYYSSFNLNYTSLFSDFYNGTSIIVKFYAINTTQEFKLYLEVLKVMETCRMDLTLYVNLDIITYLLNLNCSAFYYTSIPTLVNFSIYDFENLEWILINSSSNAEAFYKSEHDQNSDITDLIDTTNDNQVLLRFNGLNEMSEFDLYLDCLNVTVHRKLVLSYTKTFTLLGTWKYRFHIPDDDYATNWYYFDVVIREDNFMAISESPYITKWVLINNETEISTSRRFYDDMTGSYEWSLSTDSDYDIEIVGNVDMTYIHSDHPDTNYANSFEMNVVEYTTDYDGLFYYIFIDDTEYFLENHTLNSKLYCRAALLYGIAYGAEVWGVEPFVETEVTWNTRPNTVGSVLNILNQSITYPNWYYLDLGDIPNEYYGMFGEIYGDYFSISTEDASYTPKPYIIHYYSKVYVNNTLGYWYIQTDELETLTMSSSQFNDISLNAGDFFIIDCEATTDNLNIQLLNDGSVVDTLTVLQDNTNFNRQTIEITVDNDVIFDQIKFAGLFDEGEHLKCYSVTVDGYDSQTQEETTTFYVAPEESYSTLLDTGIHQLKIYDNDILRVNKFINITHDIEDNLEVYTPIYSTDCRLTLTDQDNNLLELSLFEVYITRTLSETTSRIPLLDVNFRADLSTTIIFEFYDKFSDFIKNETKEVESFIFIEITIYSLKVKNDATNQSDISITKLGSATEIEDVLAPDELYEYKLISGNYSVEWLNNENGETTTYNILLISDYILTLPTIYHQIYFAPFLSNGMGLSHDIVRFYINGSRKDFGFNTIMSKYINITVLDYFNQTAYSEVIDTTGINEYNIYLSLFSLKITNKATELVNYTITKNTLEATGYILVDEIVEYVFVSGSYDVSYTNHENMDTNTISISLTSNYVLTINTTYFNVYFSIFNFDGLGLNHDLIRFYINGLRKDLGINMLSQDVNNLKVLDYFNATLFNQTLNLRSFSEYNIYVEVWNLIIVNEYRNQSIQVEIEREGIAIEQVLPAQFSINYRFLPNMTYNISIYDLNNTLLENRSVDLLENNHIVSFGFYETEVPIIPEITIPEFIDYVFVVIIMLVVMACLGIALSITYRNYKKRNEKLERVLQDKKILRGY